ncbi:perilipin-2-like [Vespa mandarinia]|uniref:perilipin-2-like n=1 Tax=Vespa mandarinia TaxID=7446 RepID=UPI0016169154|nr:perilipin-2-like [Vespa mandarinia]
MYVAIMEVKLTDRLYRIQSVDRARKIPSLNYLFDKSTKVYDRMKGANTFVNWAFDMVENVVNIVIEKSTPVARLMEKPIYTLDKTLCQGFDFMEVKLPIIKEEPKEILDRTKSFVTNHLRPAVKTFSDLKHETKQKVRIMILLTYYKVHYLRLYSWQQADRVMSTQTGISILKTVDNTTHLVELILDKYLPASHEEIEEDTEELCSEHAKLHHTVERLTEFGSRASRRIYLALVEHSQHMYKIEILILILYALIVIQTMKVLEILFTFVFKLFSSYAYFFFLGILHILQWTYS